MLDGSEVKTGKDMRERKCCKKDQTSLSALATERFSHLNLLLYLSGVLAESPLTE